MIAHRPLPRSRLVAVDREGSVQLAAVIKGLFHPLGVEERMQVGCSNWQLAQQPSDHNIFPSSHCSPICTTPSPHQSAVITKGQSL